MTPYSNKDGKSGIAAYELGKGYIRVMFKSRDVYRYDHIRPGITAVSEMQALAIAGRGLNSYIGKYVRKNFSLKE